MSIAILRRERAVLLLAVALLPWVVLSRLGEWRVSPATLVPDTTDTTHAITSRAYVESDRVLFTAGGRRADRIRHVLATPPRAVLASQLPFSGCEPSGRDPFIPTAAASRYQPCRGPPSSATD